MHVLLARLPPTELRDSLRRGERVSISKSTVSVERRPINGVARSERFGPISRDPTSGRPARPGSTPRRQRGEIARRGNE